MVDLFEGNDLMSGSNGGVGLNGPLAGQAVVNPVDANTISSWKDTQATEDVASIATAVSQYTNEKPRHRNDNSRNRNNDGAPNGSNGRRRNGNGGAPNNTRYYEHSVYTNRTQVKVSRETNPKAAAGAIAHQARAGQPPLILASGANSINQAVKAIAIARGYLKGEGIDIYATPELGLHGTAVCLDIRKRKRNYKTLQQATDDLKIASGSDPNIVAGAIAGKIRTLANGLLGTRICLQAIGPNCVMQAVSSINVARRYLENDCLDLSFQPEFIEVSLEDGKIRNALRFSIMIQQI